MTDAHTCPICGDGGHLRVLCTVDRFTIYVCGTCTGEHAWPMPSAKDLKAYYDREAWFEGGEKGGYANYDEQTSWSTHFVSGLFDMHAGRADRSVLDVGCGYGTHLGAAAQRGWRCLGVEVSDHARGVAQQRLGSAAYVVQSIADLFPHKFDLVLMLDVLEHLPSPYQSFYELFALGAIGPDTTVVITTPNAASAEAKRDPGAWAYRHPPSHLLYYTPEALTAFLRRLRFTDIEVKGLSPMADGDLSGSAGLVVTAKGSDFQNFMHERYVPGTWSKIAAYEHVPRYRLAVPLAAGKTILDFGCGTGYGSGMLAQTAARVTGLDIDESALVWARETHNASNLNFVRHDDLGESLTAASFDLVTCFEMIEHVDHATQKRAIASIARMLRDDGLLLISTPNPEVTRLYGANPYHIREMSEAEFRDLLSPHFPLLHIFRQEVRPAVTFAQSRKQAHLAAIAMDGDIDEPPMAFIALCGRHELPKLPDTVFFDDAINYVGDFMARANDLQGARTEAYNQSLRANGAETQLRVVTGERNMALNRMNHAIYERSEMEIAMHQAMRAMHKAVHEKNELEGHLIRRTQAMEALEQQRAEELTSPRFLGRHLVQAIRDRLRQKLGKS